MWGRGLQWGSLIVIRAFFPHNLRNVTNMIACASAKRDNKGLSIYGVICDRKGSALLLYAAVV